MQFKYILNVGLNIFLSIDLTIPIKFNVLSIILRGFQKFVIVGYGRSLFAVVFAHVWMVDY